MKTTPAKTWFSWPFSGASLTASILAEPAAQQAAGDVFDRNEPVHEPGPGIAYRPL
jgi:hypothetical protein